MCFPQFGQLGPLGQHGFARNTKFEVVEETSSSAALVSHQARKQHTQQRNTTDTREAANAGDTAMGDQAAVCMWQMHAILCDTDKHACGNKQLHNSCQSNYGVDTSVCYFCHICCCTSQVLKATGTEDAKYPHPFELTVRVQLGYDGAHTFTQELAVKNTGECVRKSSGSSLWLRQYTQDRAA